MTVIGSAEVEVRPETSSFAKELESSIGSALKNPLVVAGAAIAATTAVVGGFAKKSISQFEELGTSVKGLVRLTGQSAESMSHLAFAAKETGVSTDTLGMGLKKLSVDITKHNDLLTKAGIAYTDAKGKVLPLDQTLGNVAAKFAAMPDGIAKNNLAIQLFGRSGTDLIPILNKGKNGLSALSAEADKYGLTLTGKNLEALQKNKEAHKEFSAAIEGLEVQIGANLLPILTELTDEFNSAVIPAIVTGTHWVEQNMGPIFSKAFGMAEEAGRSLTDYAKNTMYPWLVDRWHDAEPTVKGIWETVQKAFSKAKEIAENDLVPGLKSVWDWLQNNVLPAAENVASAFSNKLLPVLGSGKSSAAIWGVAGAIGAVGTALSDIQIPEALLTPGGAFVATIAALAAGFGDWNGKLKMFKDDFQPVLDSIGGKKQMVPFTGPVAGPRPTVQAPALSFGDALKEVDWNKVGQDVSTALGTAISGAAAGAEAIANGLATLMGKIDWFKLGADIGTTAVPFVLGFVFNLLNFDAVQLIEPPWVCRRLHLLGRMGSCQGDRGATRRSCENVLCGWSRRSGPSMRLSGLP